jgi:hypothetical protein
VSFDHPEEIPEDKESYEAWERTQAMTTSAEEYTAEEKIANVLSNHHEVEGQNYLGDPTRECSECGTFFPCLTNMAFSALRAVLAIPEKKTKTMTSTMEALKNSGYNQALAEVRQEIKGELK